MKDDNEKMKGGKETKMENENILIDISKSRGENRTQKIQEFANDTISKLKSNGILSIPHSFFHSFANEMSDRTKQKITSEIIDFLTDKKMIVKEKVKKTYYSFERMESGSMDFGSYSRLMASNGYYRALYKRNGINRKLVMKTKVNEKYPDNEIINPVTDEVITIWNESELKSDIDHDRQKCVVNSQKSWVKKPRHHDIITYRLL